MTPPQTVLRRHLAKGARLVAALALAGAMTPGAALGNGKRARPAGIRVEGSFAMTGRLTVADHVYGERRGQRVQRTWIFVPSCRTGPCDRVTLRRPRSGRRILDVVHLVRRGPALYMGTGRFWVALRCAGAVVRHGGLATERIAVRILSTATIGTTRVATGLSAIYTNPVRENLTRCPGGIGHDAARYRGSRITPLPGPPAPAFAAAVDPLTSTATFTDQSRAGAPGVRIVSWSWNFGDPAAPDDTSGGENASHRYRLPGVYTVSLTVRDQYGQTATATRQVTV